LFGLDELEKKCNELITNRLIDLSFVSFGAAVLKHFVVNEWKKRKNGNIKLKKEVVDQTAK